MIKIYRIGPDLAGQLAGLQSRTFREAYSGVHSPENIDDYCIANYRPEIAKADLSSVGTICCLGRLGAGISGYYVVKHQAPPVDLDSESSELKQIYVLRSAYGSGLGRALYDHALTTVQSAGNQWVWLCVSDINDRAQAFYRKRGFEKVGAGPILSVGTDQLTSSILALRL